MQPRKIRLVVNAVPLGLIGTGIGRYLRGLYGAFESRYADRYEIAYFDGRRLTQRMPAGPSGGAGWGVAARLFWRLPTALALAARLAIQARRELAFSGLARGFDLYHEASFFPYRPVPGLRTVFTIHDLSLMRHPEWHPRERVLFSRMFLKRRAKSVSAFLTVSGFTRDESSLLLGLPGERMTVTPLACDPSAFTRKSEAEAAGIRRKYSLPERYFLFVGTNDPRKRLALAAGAALRCSVPLVAVGWSGWGGELPRGVIGLGFIPDANLAGLYSGALGLVFVSSYEGFGLPILEAMSCGCPVVCSRSASLPEVAGDAALFTSVDPDAQGAGPAEEELAGLMSGLAGSGSLRRDLSARGMTQASLFSWDKTAESTERAMRMAMDTQPPSR